MIFLKHPLSFSNNHLANPENLINRFLINRSPQEQFLVCVMDEKKYLHKLCARVKEKGGPLPAVLTRTDSFVRSTAGQ
ncbi:hypothetical protein CEXT_344141 [Caerostris extrusa]|uniref:Uncharacterized protein n=1 Tax=Caerostris extrusa TaxID=172846 RepID=A0AAV4P6J2_CAEEX|nr:hypothetical protein CEXT_344141 [Caerostris extrusa]